MVFVSVAEKYPDLVEIWSDENKKKPEDVSFGTNDKYIFVCENGHRHETRPSYKNTKCKFCRIVSLAEKQPHLVDEWSDENEESIFDVPCYSNKQYKFICKNGHKYEAYAFVKAKGSDCKECFLNGITWTIDKLLSETIKDENDCNIWQYTYIHVHYNSETVKVHRLMYMLTHDNVDITDEQIRHLCNNHNCINPEHLDIGILENNGIDKDNAGTQLNGEKNHQSKLSDQDARDIRVAYDHKLKTVKQLAVKYSVCTSSIKNVINGKTFAHLLPNNDKKIENREKQRKLRKKTRTRPITEDEYKACWERIKSNVTEKPVENVNPTITLEKPCLLFNGHTDHDGYGKVNLANRTRFAHRISAIVNLKDCKSIEKKLIVNHLCSERRCCQPEHLVVVSPTEANINTLNKHRSSFSNLKDDDIREMRTLFATYSAQEIADKFNVSINIVRDIRIGKSWSHVK